MIEALGETRSTTQAAGLLGCSAAIIQTRARENHEVRTAMREQDDRFRDEIAELAIKHRGTVSKIAVELSMTPANIYYHINRSPQLRQVFQDVRDKVVDTAEENVFHKVESGDYAASVFVLKTIGKDRGYTERRETDVQVGHSVDESSTAALVGLLDSMAVTQPEAIEAEFSELSPEDRKLLSDALEVEGKQVGV